MLKSLLNTTHCVKWTKMILKKKMMNVVINIYFIKHDIKCPYLIMTHEYIG